MSGLSKLRTAVASTVWYLLPAAAISLVVLYFGAAVAWHVYPPAVPVQGTSMRPLLHAGDLVFLKGVDPKTLHKGDVIAVQVPKDAQDKYQLPSSVVHRITAIKKTDQGLFFATKGDSNPGADVFETPAAGVVGKLSGHIPGGGYPVLFLKSHQAKILLIVVGVILFLYLLLGWMDEGRRQDRDSDELEVDLLDEVRDLRQELRSAGLGQRAPPPLVTAYPTPVMPELDVLAGQVATANERGEQTSQALDRLAESVSEYALHLQSHTAVMKNLAAVTADLHQVTSDLGPRLQTPPLLADPAEAAMQARLVEAEDAIRRLTEENQQLRLLLVQQRTYEPPTPFPAPAAPTGGRAARRRKGKHRK
jgi:signal peptidase I